MLALRTCCFTCLAVLCMLVTQATCKVGGQSGNGNNTVYKRERDIAATQNDPRNDSLTSIALLEDFLDLHVKACGQIQLCTLKIEPTSILPSDNDPSACCRACSCDDGCQRSGNCCPDYQFLKTVGNVTFDNVTQLLATVVNTEMSHEGVVEATAQPVNMVGECTRLQVAPVESIGPRGQDYIMVTSCLNEYTNTTVSNKCQNPGPYFNHNVPVYSKQTDKSYKNINCALCNDLESSNLIYWQPIMLVKYLYYQGTHYDDTDALLERVKTKRSRNLVFEPDDPSIKAERCVLVTKDTCPESESDVEETRILRGICERFYLPVEGVHIERQMFRNIACYRCDVVAKYARKFCYSPIERWPVFSAYVDMSQPRSSRAAETLSEVFDVSGRCDQGYVFDIDKAVCRKVLCPRNFYIANGRCRLMFTKIIGTRYQTMMRMELTEEMRRTFTSEQLVQFISNFLARVLTETTQLASFSFALYEKSNEYYIIILKFSFENNVSYLQDVLDTVEEMVQRLSRHPMVKVVGIYSTSSANTMPNMTVYDLQTGSKLVAWIPARPSSDTIISRLDFCYQKRLDPEELKTSMFFSVIKASGNRISNLDLDSVDDEYYVICVDNLAQPPRDVANSPQPRGDRKTKTVITNETATRGTGVPWEEVTDNGDNGHNDTAWSSFQRGLLVVGTILVLLLIIIILRNMLKRSL